MPTQASWFDWWSGTLCFTRPPWTSSCPHSCFQGKPFFACRIWGSNPSTSNLELNEHPCSNYWFQADALFHLRLLIWALFPQSGHYGKSCTLVTSKDNRRMVILTTNPFCRLQTSLIITALPLPETPNQERASMIRNSLSTLSCISLWHSLIVLNSQQLS